MAAWLVVDGAVGSGFIAGRECEGSASQSMLAMSGSKPAGVHCPEQRIQGDHRWQERSAAVVHCPLLAGQAHPADRNRHESVIVDEHHFFSFAPIDTQYHSVRAMTIA